MVASGDKPRLDQQCAKRGGDQARELSTQFTAFKDNYDDMNFTTPYLSTIKARTLIVHGDRDIFFLSRSPSRCIRPFLPLSCGSCRGGNTCPSMGRGRGSFSISPRNSSNASNRVDARVVQRGQCHHGTAAALRSWRTPRGAPLVWTCSLIPINAAVFSDRLLRTALAWPGRRGVRRVAEAAGNLDAHERFIK